MRSLVRTFLRSLQCPCRAFLRTVGGRGISCQYSLAMRGKRWASDQLEPIRVVKINYCYIHSHLCPHRTTHLPCISFVKLLQNLSPILFIALPWTIKLFRSGCLVLYCLQLMAVKQIEGYSIFMTKVLGKGSYGSVYLAKQQATGQEVAAKILSKDSIDRDQYLKAALKNEIDIIQKLHSDNIVGFYDVMESSKNYYIIQELCDGDLAAEIKPGMQRPEAEAVEMLRQICNGFLALVKEGIIHRDLKPANVMKKGKVLKLGDFGFAKQMGPKSMVSTCVGTPLYMSLQILRGEEYTSKCDIWALGFIFYQMLHGDTPWTANTELQLVRNIEKQPLNIKRKGLSPETEDFLRRCLQLAEDRRISWDQIFVHPIFRGYFQDKCDGQQFQNKMKMIMNKLRFYISQKNLDLKKIMDSLGFTANKKEISYHEFYHFFQHVYPEISNQDADYLFKKTDSDLSGAISVQELKALLVSNGIKLDAQFDAIPSFEKQSDGKETFQRISAQASRKIKSCFQKLYRIITRNGLTLWKVFNDFDKKKGSLTLAEFTLLIRKISSASNDVSEDEIKCGFELIDEDASNSIEFAELDKYYSKVNGIPETSAPRNYEPMQIESEGNITQSPPRRSQKQPEQTQYQQYPQQPYPQQYPSPQQNYNPPPQQNYNPPPAQQYQSYQYPHQGYPPQQGYMNYSNNNGNMNIPMGGFGYNNNNPYSYPVNNGGFPEQNTFNSSQGFNRPPPPQNQQPPNQNYNTNFNPFDMLSRRV